MKRHHKNSPSPTPGASQPAKVKFNQLENLREAIASLEVKLAVIELEERRFVAAPVAPGIVIPPGYPAQLMERKLYNQRKLDELHRELRLSEPSSGSRAMRVDQYRQEDFTHSPDYRSVRFKAKLFTLTTSQAAVVQTLDENMLNGTPDVSGEGLIEVADSSGSRLRDIFKANKEAWKALITKGTRKGTYRINRPEAKSPAVHPKNSADSH